ncbi:hypothetical protein ACA910_001344 [Epithemia clementina (nom. ined.)]
MMLKVGRAAGVEHASSATGGKNHNHTSFVTSLNDATSPIPEEEESVVSEGFQGDRIQVAVRLRPLHKGSSSSSNDTGASTSKLLHLPRRSTSGNNNSNNSSPYHSKRNSSSLAAAAAAADDTGSVSSNQSVYHNHNKHAGSGMPSSLSSHSTSAAGAGGCWTVVNHDTLVLKPGHAAPHYFSQLGRKKKLSNQYTVDHVFDETMDTRSVYREMGRPIVQSALTGRHGTLFAYGQTGSGKTFTLQGSTAASSSGQPHGTNQDYPLYHEDEDDNEDDQENEVGHGQKKQPQHQEGLIPLAMADLFQAIHTSTSRDWEVKVQYFEIYNEVVQDLIASTPPESRSSAANHPKSLWNSRLQNSSSDSKLNHVHKTRRPLSRSQQHHSQPELAAPVQPAVRLPTLKLLEDGNGTVHVNAREMVVTSAEECVRLLRKGNRARAMAATDANQHSSRSHAIFRVSLTSRPKPSCSTTTKPTAATTHRGGGGSSGAVVMQSNEPTTTTAATTRWSVLNFVDLAGSENSGRALASASSSAFANTSSSSSSSNGDPSSSSNLKNSLKRRQREGAKINQSLLSLSRVIYALSLPESKRPAHIGFRDSKLTRILQPSLSGNAAMAILCCASLAKADVSETKSTLKFATSAKRIPLKPVVNEVLLVNQYQNNNIVSSPRSVVSAAADAEKDVAFAQLQNEMLTVKQALREFQERFQEMNEHSSYSTMHAPKPPAVGVGRLAAGSAFSLLDSSMGSSEETPTVAPPAEDHPHHQRHAYLQSSQQQQQQQHLPQRRAPSERQPAPERDPPPTVQSCSNSSEAAVLHTPISQSPLSPPLLPRQHRVEEPPQHPPTQILKGKFGDVDDNDHHHDHDEDQNSMSPPPPLAEVEISADQYYNHGKLVLSDRGVMDEQRANYLEERIEMTESLVERIYTELNITRHAMLEYSVRNAELQEQLIGLQRQIADHEEDDNEHGLDAGRGGSKGGGLSLFSSWFILVCIVLYAFGMRDFFISAIIFLWLSLQVLK